VQLERERRRKGEPRTVQELQSMVEVLEKEALTNRGNASKRQALLAEVEAARQAARTAASSSEVIPLNPPPPRASHLSISK